MLKNKTLLIKLKIAFACLGFSAVITELIVVGSRGTLVPANFFSFFTIQSNLFAATMLLVSAWALYKRKAWDLRLWRGAATLYMATTGIVFAVLLAGLDVELTAVPWDNIVLHYIMPVVLVADWLLDPPRPRLALHLAILWLLFPIAYVTYSLIRGELVGWYPYPFLNPAMNNGYTGVALTAVGIALTVVALAWALIHLQPKEAKTRPRMRRASGKTA